MDIFYKNQNPIIFFLLLLFVYYSPQILLFQEAHYKVHDFLDDGSYNFKPLWESGQMFNFSSDAKLEYAMNGLPRSGMHSGLIAMVCAYAFFPAFWVHWFFFVLGHIVAFVGMYLLLKRHFLKEHQHIWIICGVAFCFAIIPHFEIYGFSTTGQPLLLYAFLNFQKKQQRWFDFIIITLFPFFSFFVRGGFALILLFFCIGLYNLYKYKSLNRGYFIMLFVFSLLYPLIEFQMFYGHFMKPFVSFREELRSARIMELNFYKASINAIKTFFFSSYHSGMCFMGLIIALTIACFFKNRITKNILFLSGSIIVTSLTYGFYPLFVDTFDAVKIIRMFQFSYIAFLLSLFWMLLFALVLKQLQLNPLRISVIILLEVLIISYSNQEWKANSQKIFGINNEQKYPSYRSFYSKKVFSQVAKFIHKSQKAYRVIGVGIQPSVMQYNGFYTLDSYQINYPLEYKHQFRKIFSQELSKDERNRKYFDYWGGRCQIFVNNNAINKMEGKYFLGILDNLQINTSQIKKMRGDYILSGSQIKNTQDLNIKFLRVFAAPDEYWKVFLYTVQ